MTPPVVTAARLSGAAHRERLPLLVLGPALGTSAASLWTASARSGLTEAFDVIAWDLPGHGYNHSVPEDPFSVSDLAQGLLRVVDDVCEQRGDLGARFAYAGCSVGGAVGLQLLLDHPGRVASAVLLGTGARLGEPAMWEGRIGQVSVSGTGVMVPGSAERWFAPGFLDRCPDVGSALLHALSDADDRGYALVCQALADFDVRSRLEEVDAPVLAVAGGLDVATPPLVLRQLAEGVRDGSHVELAGTAHLAPAEQPDRVAQLILGHVLGPGPGPGREPVAGPEGRRAETAPDGSTTGSFAADLDSLVADHAARGLTASQLRELLLLHADTLDAPGPDGGSR